MSFAAPLFLLATLAGLIPVLLHMINRQKAPEVPFSTLRFLQLSVQRTRRRKTVHDILLLLLRVAALVLVAIALARPTIRPLGGLVGGAAVRAVAIVLDNSASMATVDETGPRWEIARQAAETLLDQLGPRDSVALLVTCGPQRRTAERLYQQHEVVSQALDASQISDERADLRAALAQATERLATAKAPSRELYVITDMQAVSWRDPEARGQSTNGRAVDGQAVDGQAGGDARDPPKPSREPAQATDGNSGRETKADVPLVVVDVHGPVLPNTGLGHLQLSAAAPVTGIPLRVTGTIVGDATIPQQKHVELYLDNKRHAVSPTLAVEPGGRARYTFHFTLDQPGIHQGQLRLVGDDACPRDNRRFFALALDRQIDVAIVQPSGQEIAYLQDGYYLERALAPVRSGTWAIRPALLTPQQAVHEPLAKYAVVFCVNLPAPSLDLAERLHDYASAGGHLVWTCGDRVDPADYAAVSKQLGRELLPSPVAASRGPPPDRAEPWHIGWLDDQYPPLAPLVKPASLYQSVLVKRHMPLVLSEGTPVRVLAKLDDGTPLLVQRPVGSGSVLLLATSVHVDWTNLPLRPIFLPLVARLTFHLVGGDAGQRQLVAGTPISVALVDPAKTTVEIVRPSGETVRLGAAADQAGAGPTTIRYPDTHEVGVYQVTIATPERTRQRAVAANLDPAELDSTRISRTALETELRPRSFLFCSDPANLAEVVGQLREGKSLWDAFLIAVLIALLAEAYLANRRGATLPAEC
jgi:hypothetical protein